MTHRKGDSMDDIANKIEELTHELDRLYQEGVIFYPSAIKTLEISITNIQALLQELKTVSKHQVYSEK